MIVRTYTIQIKRYGDEIVPLFEHQLAAHLNEMEQNLTDLLPEGYKARISEWDQPEGEPDA